MAGGGDDMDVILLPSAELVGRSMLRCGRGRARPGVGGRHARRRFIGGGRGPLFHNSVPPAKQNRLGKQPPPRTGAQRSPVQSTCDFPQATLDRGGFLAPYTPTKPVDAGPALDNRHAPLPVDLGLKEESLLAYMHARQLGKLLEPCAPHASAGSPMVCN